MIHLYNPNNVNFEKNGDVILTPISCEVECTLNGSWELNLSHAIDKDNRWKSIVETAVVKVQSFNGEQLFRINKTEKQDESVIATALPIFMDAMGDCFLLDIRPTGLTGQEAITRILSPNPKYMGLSNITKKSTAYYVLKNAIEAIAGADNSFLNRWGGEIEYDNYTIKINESIGKDNGVQILYCKNIPTNGVSESISMEEVVTRIIPKAFNGRMLAGNSPWVDSPIISTYPTVYTRVIEYEDIILASDVEGDDTEGKIVCDTLNDLYAELRNAANEEFNNDIDKPKVSISCEMILLQNTEEYKNYAQLEKVSLGDIVHCRHSRLGIETTAKIVSTVWDCINQSAVSVTIGTVETNFLDRIASTVNATERALTTDGEVKAGQIQGIIDGANARVVAQADGVTAQKEKVILFEDLDSNSNTYGAMALGTTGFMISDTRNAENTDWVWSTFGTGKGFSADLIVAGVLSAIDIYGSTITGSVITGSTIRSTKDSSESDPYSYSSTIWAGNAQFTELDSRDSSYKSYVNINGHAITFDTNSVFAQLTPSQHSIFGKTNGSINQNIFSTLTYNALNMRNNNAYIMLGFDSTGSPYFQLKTDSSNYIQITPNNIYIYKNGAIVWQAI